MKNLLVVLGILFSMSAMASDNLVGDDAPISVEAQELRLANATGLRVSVGENSAQVKFAVTYSNSCVAGSHFLEPKLVRQYLANSEKELITVIAAQSNEGLPIACPMIYSPVTRSYEMTVSNLYPGGRYDFVLFGTKRRVSVEIPQE
jgi:hypothetical protein